MKTCIICRTEKPNSDFNDEHVIPDSIQGYYHIYNVCTDCNWKMGGAIDNKLTNHKFIEFQRHLLSIKGKSGDIPNPFAGTHTLKDDPEQKVQLILDDEGKFVPKLLPKVHKEISAASASFSFTLDIQDIGKKDVIIEKFLQRNGIPRESVKFEETKSTNHSPIGISLKIDAHNFKLGILKIAYEFTVDQVSAYFDDPTAILMSKILYNADFRALDKVPMYGDGMSKEILEPFAHLIDFENDNHYLILFDSEIGLLCFVNLFSVFSLGFKMSDRTGFIKDNLLVGKNDIINRKFTVYNINEVVAQTYTPNQYRFQYFLPDQETLDDFILNDKKPDFEFYRINDKIPFFDRNGDLKYGDIDIKLQQNQLEHVYKGDTKNDMITEIKLDEELFIKLLPINKIYQVISVQLEQQRKSKL